MERGIELQARGLCEGCPAMKASFKEFYGDNALLRREIVCENLWICRRIERKVEEDIARKVGKEIWEYIQHMSPETLS